MSTVVNRAISAMRERVRTYNSGQRRVFWGMVALLFINAAILTSGIILLSILLQKLSK